MIARNRTLGAVVLLAIGAAAADAGADSLAKPAAAVAPALRINPASRAQGDGGRARAFDEGSAHGR